MLNGGYYEGEWFNCMRDGFGLHVKLKNSLECWADGGYYEGEWKTDKAEGKGKLGLFVIVNNYSSWRWRYL